MGCALRVQSIISPLLVLLSLVCGFVHNQCDTRGSTMYFLLIPIRGRHELCTGLRLRILHAKFSSCRFQLVHCILVVANLILHIFNWRPAA